MMLDMTDDEPKRIGRPPLPPEQRGRKVLLYLSAEALEALRWLVGDGNQSALVSKLLVDAWKRARRKR